MVARLIYSFPMMYYRITILVCLLPFGMYAQKQGKPLLPFCENHLWGFLDTAGHVIIPAKYLAAGVFSEGLAPVRLAGHFGYINELDSLVIEAKYEFAEPFKRGIAKVWQDGARHQIDYYTYFDKPQFQYIGRDGKLFFDSNLRFLTDFESDNTNSAIVFGRSTYGRGVVYVNGEMIIDTIFEDIKPFKYGYLVKRHNSKLIPLKTLDGKTISRDIELVFMDTKGSIIVQSNELICDNQWLIKDDAVLVKWVETVDSFAILTSGKIVEKGRFISDPLNETILPTNIEQPYHQDTIIKARTELRENRFFGNAYPTSRWFLYDGTGKLVSNRYFREVFYYPEKSYKKGFSDGLALVYGDGQVELIDTLGNTVLKLPKNFNGGRWRKIEDIWVFDDENLFGAHRLFDGTNKYLLPIEVLSVDYAFGIREGILHVTLPGNFSAYINRKGKLIWFQKYEPLKDKLIQMNLDQALEGWLPSINPPATAFSFDEINWDKRHAPKLLDANHAFPQDSLCLTLSPEKNSDFKLDYAACTLFLTNTRCDTQWIRGEDGALPFYLQALHPPSGEWRNIHFIRHSWCGNSRYNIPIVPGEIRSYQVPIFDGIWETKLRVLLPRSRYLNGEPLPSWVSNEIPTRVNPAQFWRVPTFDKRGHWKVHVDDHD
jgi:hypothetical protein